MLVGSGVSVDREGFALRLVACGAGYYKSRQLLIHLRNSSEQLPHRASAAESLIPSLLSHSFLLFQLCTDVNKDWQCGSFPSYTLSALVLAPSSSPAAHPSYHVFLNAAATCAVTSFSGLSTYIPSSAVRILPDSWSQLSLKYFPSTVYVWCRKNLMIKVFNDYIFFYLKNKFMSGDPFKVPEWI